MNVEEQWVNSPRTSKRPHKTPVSLLCLRPAGCYPGARTLWAWMESAGLFSASALPSTRPCNKNVHTTCPSPSWVQSPTRPSDSWPRQRLYCSVNVSQDQSNWNPSCSEKLTFVLNWNSTLGDLDILTDILYRLISSLLQHFSLPRFQIGCYFLSWRRCPNERNPERMIIKYKSTTYLWLLPCEARLCEGVKQFLQDWSNPKGLSDPFRVPISGVKITFLGSGTA